MGKKTYKALITVITISLISKLIGFIRDIYHAKALGTTSENDAYFLAFVITYTFITIIIVAINSTFIPTITSKIKDDASTKDKTINVFLNFYFIVGVILFLIMYLIAPLLINFIANGFDNYHIRLTIRLVRIMSLSLPLVGVLTILNGILQYNERYVIPTLIGIFPSFFIILSSVFLKFPLNIYGISISYFLGYIVLIFMAALVITKKNLFRIKINFDLNDKYLKNSLIILIPILIATVFQQIDIIVTRYFASQVGEGGVSALSYANRLTLVGVNLIAYAISMVMYPKFSILYRDRKYKKFSKNLLQAFEFSFYIFIPITLFVFLYSKEIVEFVFERGTFDEQSTMLTASALKYISLAMLPLTIREFMNKAYYSILDTKTPVILSGITIVINIVLAYLLVNAYGLSGITIAYTISSSILAVLLIIMFRIKHFLSIDKSFILIVIKNIVLGIITLFVLLMSINLINKFDIRNVYKLCINLTITLISYLIFSLLLKINIVVNFISSFNKN